MTVHRFAPALPIVLAVSVLIACGGSSNNAAGGGARSNAIGGGTGLNPVVTPPPPLLGRGFPSQGNSHVSPGDAHVAYNSDPPTSGPHLPTVPRRGVYTTPFITEFLPHYLEHGGVEVLYNASAPPSVVKALTDLVNQELDREPGQVLMAPRPEMPCQITASAWTRLLAFGAPDCQPGATGRALVPGSADMTLVRQFIERNECVYDPENICGNGPKGDLQYPTTGTATAAALASAPAGTPGAHGPFPSAPALTIDTSATYIATIKTSKGDIIIQLDAQAAPLTVNNFVFLAQRGFYDGLTCHRVIPGFVAQCGDPNGDGGGGPGYTISDEPSPLKHDSGMIAMAKSNLPNSAGSQFYITLAPQPALDGKYTVFGKVVQGFDMAQKLRPRDPSTTPNLPPGDQIISISVAKQ